MTRAAEKPWTADQDAILISMAVDADSWDAVAGVLGRGVGSIRGRAHKLGLRLNAAKVHARRKANVAAAVQRLDVRAKTAAACKLSWTPERRMQASARAKANDSIQFALAKPCEEAARIAAIARHWSKWREWCPAYLWPSYRYYIDTKLMRAAEARAIVCDDFARDLRRALKAIAAVATEQHAEQRRHYRSFEAELERAKRNGIREVIPMVRADFHLSLTGGSLG